MNRNAAQRSALNSSAGYLKAKRHSSYGANGGGLYSSGPKTRDRIGKAPHGQKRKRISAQLTVKQSGMDLLSFVPPVALQIDSPHGAHLLALGRRKWRSQGGYPTLTHGGLSLLEVLSPFVELSK